VSLHQKQIIEKRFKRCQPLHHGEVQGGLKQGGRLEHDTQSGRLLYLSVHEPCSKHFHHASTHRSQWMIYSKEKASAGISKPCSVTASEAESSKKDPRDANLHHPLS